MNHNYNDIIFYCCQLTESIFQHVKATKVVKYNDTFVYVRCFSNKKIFSQGNALVNFVYVIWIIFKQNKINIRKCIYSNDERSTKVHVIKIKQLK